MAMKFDPKTLLEQAEKHPAVVAELEGSQLFAVCKNGKIYQYHDLVLSGQVTVQEIPADVFLAELTGFLAKVPPRKSSTGQG